MWSRAELKNKAKAALKQNYWKIVLVAIIAGLVGGETSSGSNLDTSSFEESFKEGFELGYESSEESDETYQEYYDLEYSDQYDESENSDEYWEGYFDGSMANEFQGEEYGDYADGYNDGYLDYYGEDTYDSDYEVEFAPEDEETDAIVGGLLLAMLIFVYVVLIIAVLVAVFLYYPLEAGTRRFFIKSLNQPAEVKEVAFAYDHGYKNVIKIIFLSRLYVSLWSLLFVIPGIVKSYEYMMIPYLLAENPNMSKEEAFRLSKQMMTGNKWNAFVLDWSFFGWDMLSAFTLGILSIFYVQPYKHLTKAALYEELSAINGYPARATIAQPNMGSPYMQAQYTETPVYEQPVQEEHTYTDNTYNSPE